MDAPWFNRKDTIVHRTASYFHAWLLLMGVEQVAKQQMKAIEVLIYSATSSPSSALFFVKWLIYYKREGFAA